MRTYKIFVPTLGRMGTASTLKILPKDRIIVVVRRPELEYYRDNGFRVLLLPESIAHVGQTRQYIFENAGCEYAWTVDDDLTMDNIIEGIEYITFYADQEEAGLFAFGEHAFMNYRREADGNFSRAGMVCRVWGVDCQRYFKASINMNDWPLCGDSYTNLSMQKAGYKVLVSNIYDHGGVGAKTGGCESYRSPELVTKQLLRLKELFPDWMTIIPHEGARRQRQLTNFKVRYHWSKMINRELRV